MRSRRRLFHFLHKKIRVYLEMLPRIDSDEVFLLLEINSRHVTSI